MTLFATIVYAAENAQLADASSGGIGALGLDTQALLFQVLNFAILLFILNKIAYRPILRILEDRRKKIETSLQTAKEIELLRTKLEEQQKAVLLDAQAQAQSVLEESRKQAEQIIARAEKRALDRANQLIADAQAQINQTIEDTRVNLRRETLALVALATERIIDQKLDPQKDETLIRSALKQVLGQSEGGQK